jgi:hypothetical protein
MDGEDNNFASGLSNVICKDGQTTTTAAIPFASGIKTNDGTVTTPPVTFTSEPTTGLYRVSAGILGVAVLSVNTVTISSNNMTSGTHYTVSAATPLYSAGTSTGYYQISSQNKSSGTTASTDFVATADTGTDTTNYVNLGINSSGFTGTTPFSLALDAYLYSQSSNMNVGTVGAKALNFATNNTVVAAFDSSGNFSINTNKFTVANSTGNTVIAGTTVITGATTLTGGIVGTTTNDNASAGNVGEIISSTVLAGSAVALTTSVTANITSISLTAGDWDVWGNIAFVGAGGASSTIYQAAINTTSATLPTAPASGAYGVLTLPSGASNATQIMQAGQQRLSLASTTTVYLVASTVFAGGTCTGYGYIGARRRR